MESIGVAMCFSSEIYMRAFKLSATASLLLLLLPSLVFSVLLLALFSLVLFLPIACAFAAVFLFASIFVRIPLLGPVRKSLNFVSTVENSQVCLVFDRSEVPFEEEGTTEGEEEESEDRGQEFVESDGEEIQMERREEDSNAGEQEEWLNDIKMISHENWGRLSSFSSSLNSHEGHGFHGILAFWRRKESEAEEAAIAR